MLLIGVIADTHGLLRPQVREALAGVELILHAGDIGSEEVLAGLRLLGPVQAVRGNVDVLPWAAGLPREQVVEAGGARVLLLHDLVRLTRDPGPARLQAVIFGHSHRPAVYVQNGVLYLNPGSAGPRRFRLPVTLARLRVAGETLEPEIVPLLDGESS
ncbi:MAG: metallophosphoesterase family protein [Desulfobacteraceae bacterium]|nr:metallophosphoesterase family protein [Desulfobacteraceae bacterium]